MVVFSVAVGLGGTGVALGATGVALVGMGVTFDGTGVALDGTRVSVGLGVLVATLAVAVSVGPSGMLNGTSITVLWPPALLTSTDRVWSPARIWSTSRSNP
jgi:hypothetical protein